MNALLFCSEFVNMSPRVWSIWRYEKAIGYMKNQFFGSVLKKMFQQHTRLSFDTFRVLISVVGPSLEQKITNMKHRCGSYSSNSSHDILNRTHIPLSSANNRTLGTFFNPMMWWVECQTTLLIRALGSHQHVIPSVPLIHWMRAVPHGTPRSLGLTFVSIRLLSLTIRHACTIMF